MLGVGNGGSVPANVGGSQVIKVKTTMVHSNPQEFRRGR